MNQRKQIEQYDPVVYKYSKENVEAHKRNPEWYPKVNTEGMCIERVGSALRVQWEGFKDSWLIEEDRVGVKRKKNA
jgi:hypothetical protein